MSITTGALLYEYGTQATVISDTSAITNTSFNAGTTTALTQTDYCPTGDVVLNVTMAVAPSAGASFLVYRRDINIDSTNDAPVPDASFKSIFVGAIYVDLVTTAQYLSLPNIPLTIDQEFYIENDTGQSTSGTTVLKVTPKTHNTKA